LSTELNDENLEIMKQRIIDKATELFGRYGYSAIKTDQLASELGMSKRTLYQHFHSKKAILEEVMKSISEKTEQNMISSFNKIKKDKENIIEYLIDAFENNIKISSILSEHFFIDIRKNMPQILESFVHTREENLRRNFDKIFEIGLELGFFKENINKDILYLIHFYAMKYILNPKVLSHLSLSISEALRQIHIITMSGALTQKGIERFGMIDEKLNQIGPCYIDNNYVT